MTDEANGPLRRVLIVGGGTAGWMAAVYLNRVLARQGTQVTLVESPDVGTIGVGEATTPSIIPFIRSLGLPEGEFLRRCSATYKLAIRFQDWVRPGHAYWHPFGLCGGRINDLDLFHFWLKMRLEEGRPGAYADYSVQARLAEAGRAPRPLEGTSPIFQMGTFAYHLDAAAFATTLREIATSEGVTHLYGTVREVVLDGRGWIEAVDIGAERRIEADLFIDCTGFTGALIEKALGEPWTDWSDLLLCDRAVVMPLPREDEMAPYTQSTALSAGWAWRIPLQSRVGTGYVHSSRHIGRDEAAEALLARAGLRRARSADPRFLQMRIGRRPSPWRGNCVAIGLAAGFVEPLESTGIHLIQRGLELLVDDLPDRRFAPPLQESYNRAMGSLFEEIRDFILLHYLTSWREEPFWRDARSVPLPDSLQRLLALYDENGRVKPDSTSVFGEANHYFILAGSERLPRRAAARAALAPAGETRDVLDRIRAQGQAVAAAMPSHRALVDALAGAPALQSEAPSRAIVG